MAKRLQQRQHRRAWPTLLALISAVGAVIFPAPAQAACGVTDPGGCVDGALYSFWYGLAGMGWAIDRTLLTLAYQLDTFRWWLVTVAFTSAYQVLVQTINPLIVPFATLAVIIGCLALLLLPLLGRTNLVNVRHALVWTLLAPLLLTLSGPLIVQIEQFRSDVGEALFTGVRSIAPGAIFGATGTDMQAPTPLYPANPCGNATLTRRAGAGLHLDDLAAALLWANAQDIHCPDKSGPSADIPDRFYEAAPSGAGYARDQDISMMDAGNDRTEAVVNMQRGAIRTFLGVLPAGLAVLDALVQLVFSLCLVALWIGLPIGLLFVFFQQTASGVTGLGRRFLGVLQVSWSSSVLLGIVTACLIAAANLRNAAAYTGFAIGGLVLTSYMLFVAVDTLKDCIRTLNDTVAAGTGLSVTRPFEVAGQMASTAIGIGAGVATGGAAAALTATAAMQQTGSGRYAAAATLGRIRPLAQLGEVAAAMGVVSDSDVLDGLHAGQRSTQGNWRGTRMQLAADAQRTDAQGRTTRDRAQERRLARQVERAQHPTVVQEVSDAISGAQRAAAYATSPQIATDLSRAAHYLPDRTNAAWQRVRGSWQTFRHDVTQQHGGASNVVVRGAAAVQVLDDRLRPGQRDAVMQLNEQRQIRYSAVPPTPPTSAQMLPRDQVRVPRLLTLGYAVHERTDQTVAFWKPAPPSIASPTPGAPSVRAAEERLQLVKAGALRGTLAEAQAALDTAKTVAQAQGQSQQQGTP